MGANLMQRLVYFNKSFIPIHHLLNGVFATQICNSYTVGLTSVCYVNCVNSSVLICEADPLLVFV